LNLDVLSADAIGSFMNKITILLLELMDLNVLFLDNEFPPMLVGTLYDLVRLSCYKM
jgi:hypothetical protein